MDPRKNPFTPGAGDQPPALVGRDALLEASSIAIDRTLNGLSTRSQILTGLRGVGKTVLLNAFSRQAENAGMIPCAIEAPPDGTFLSTLSRELQLVSAQLTRTGPVTATIERMKDLVQSFSVNVDATGSMSLGYSPKVPSHAQNLEVDLRQTFSAIGHAAHEANTGVHLAIDELQYCNGTELGALISATHRATQLQLPIIITAAGLPGIKAAAHKQRTYTERLFVFTDLGNLTRDEISQAICTPLARHNATIDDDAIDAIAKATQGYPYFVQEWAHDAWNAAPTPNITEAIIDDIRPMIEQRLDQTFYAARFDRLAPRERLYLTAMARLGPGPHATGVIAAALGKDSARVGSIRGSLEDKGIIFAPSFGETAFTAPGFDGFLLRSADATKPNASMRPAPKRAGI